MVVPDETVSVTITFMSNIGIYYCLKGSIFLEKSPAEHGIWCLSACTTNPVVVRSQDKRVIMCRGVVRIAENELYFTREISAPSMRQTLVCTAFLHYAFPDEFPLRVRNRLRSTAATDIVNLALVQTHPRTQLIFARNLCFSYDDDDISKFRGVRGLNSFHNSLTRFFLQAI